MNKIEMAKNLVESLPKPITKGFVLCDSCKAIFTVAVKAGYSYIGALKTNRVIYPDSHERLGIKLHQFAKSLNIDDFDLATVKNQEYYIYNYIGKLKDVKNVSIVLSYHKESFQKDGCLKVFISLDSFLKDLDILIQYTDRWAIELFFRDCKTSLGLDNYQIRSERGINRYLIIIIINYTYYKLYSNEVYHFNTGFKLIQNDLKKAQIVWIYNAAARGNPIEKILQTLKIA